MLFIIDIDNVCAVFLFLAYSININRSVIKMYVKFVILIRLLILKIIIILYNILIHIVSTVLGSQKTIVHVALE